VEGGKDYFLILVDSAEFASLLAPLEEVDTLDHKSIRTGKVPKQW